MLDKLYFLLTWLIDKFGRPRQTFGMETDKVLEQKRAYERLAKGGVGDGDDKSKVAKH